MRWLVIVALGGCGFTHGTLASDAREADASDAPADTPSDTQPAPTCYAKWLDGSIRFDTPVALATVNSSGYERDPWLPADELTIYFSTARGGLTDVWMATRASIAEDFGTPAEASEFNSTSSETKLSISADGKIAVVGSDRPGSVGVDVWEAIRTSTTQAWPAMDRTDVIMAETTGNDQDPTLSADGMHLYLAPDNVGAQRLVMATRGGNGVFGAPVDLATLNSGSGDADPSPTPDERILVFSSHRYLEGAGNGDLWYGTRGSPAEEFGSPRAVPDVNTGASEGDPHLSSDGCRLYFARYVGGLDWELYVASAQP